MKKSLLIFAFLLIIFPVLIYIVGQRVRLQPKAGGGIDPRAVQQSNLVFPVVPVGVVGVDNSFFQAGAQLDSRFIFQNLSDQTNNVQLSLRSSSGVVVSMKTIDIPPMGQKEVSFDQSREGFDTYSLTANSNHGLMGLLKLVNNSGVSFSSDGYRSYLSEEQSRTWYFALKLGGVGRAQNDRLGYVISTYNPNSFTVPYKITVYSENGQVIAEENRNVSAFAVDNFKGAGEGYGGIKVESDRMIISHATLTSDKRLSFIRGKQQGSAYILAPFPFVKTNGGCNYIYSAEHPYCGEARLVFFNTDPSNTSLYSIWGLKSNGEKDLIVQSTFPPHNTFVFSLGGYDMYLLSGGVASIYFESDKYWQTTTAFEDTNLELFIPYWSRYSLPYNSFTNIAVFNGSNKMGKILAEYYDSFGRLLGTEEKDIGPYGKVLLEKSIGFGVNFGTVRVRSDSGLPLIAYVVGSDEVNQSGGRLLAGDGGFIYGATGYIGDVINPPTSWYPGWNVLAHKYGGGMQPIDNVKCGSGSVRVNKFWRVIYYSWGSVAGAATNDNSIDEYMRCGVGS